MSSKDSPQFPFKLLGLPDTEILFQEPRAISASSRITIFLIRFKFCHAVMLVQAAPFIRTGCLVTCPDQKGLKVCSPGRESPAQGLVCTTPMYLTGDTSSYRETWTCKAKHSYWSQCRCDKWWNTWIQSTPQTQFSPELLSCWFYKAVSRSTHL